MASNKVGKKGMERISCNINKATSLKDALIAAANDYEDVKVALKELNERKITKEKESKEPNLDLADIKNAPKIIMDER